MFGWIMAALALLLVAVVAIDDARSPYLDGKARP